jgi:crotonobetainyl-CoA:carnitine CoA-transferase CaiB-like acyl-CoA transferase
MNRGKKSLCLNMAKEESRQIVYRLVEKADIGIHDKGTPTLGEEAPPSWSSSGTAKRRSTNLKKQAIVR